MRNAPGLILQAAGGPNWWMKKPSECLREGDVLHASDVDVEGGHSLMRSSSSTVVPAIARAQVERGVA